MAAVSADGSTVCVLILRLNSSCNRSIAFVVRTLRHWPGGNRVKANKRSPASSRLSATARCLRRHLRDESLATGLDLPPRGCIGHVVVIGCDLVMRARGRMRQQIPVLVNRAAMDRWTGTSSQTAAIAARQSATHLMVERGALRLRDNLYDAVIDIDVAGRGRKKEIGSAARDRFPSAARPASRLGRHRPPLAAKR